MSAGHLDHTVSMAGQWVQVRRAIPLLARRFVGSEIKWNPSAAHERPLARSRPSEEHTHLRFNIVVWTSLEAVQWAIGQDYGILWRQKASDVVFGEDVTAFSISPVLIVLGNDALV
jgi:hypothetical protein